MMSQEIKHEMEEKMNKSQEIIDKIHWLSFIGILRYKVPLWQQLEKLPCELREQMKEVKSDELMKIRPDACV